ncbi:MAG: glycosyltransferase family 39 protein [Deltaproteobacteria bacterium]|nr:glycosyltransferase family 39 protein [Deltaproteobacteria bacterium]
MDSTRWRSTCALVGGLIFAFLLMAHDGHAPFGIVAGAAAIAVAGWGAVGLLRRTSEGGKEEEYTLAPRALGLSAGLALLSMTALGMALFAAGRGILGGSLSAVAVTGAYLATIASIAHLAGLLGLVGQSGAWRWHFLLRLPGFWLMALAGAIALPALGLGSLWDPWETHYGEVAREMLSRDDWISPWWSWQGFFYSKPVLSLWLQALFMGALGVRWQPDQMLQGSGGSLAHPEWVVRAPVVLLSLAALYICYRAITRSHGTRAAILGVVALATMPFWFLLSHQTMTDMPFVAPLTASFALMVLALHTDAAQESRARRFVVGGASFRVAPWQLVAMVVFVVVVPQILYLLTRNVELVLHGAGPHGFRWHLDEVLTGSTGNCGLPGNAPCQVGKPSGRLEPSLQAVLWLGLLGVLLARLREVTHIKSLLYIAAWICAAIAVMAKGPAGWVIPAMALAGTCAVSGRWRELLSTRVVEGALAGVLLVMPWVVAMVVRHGSAFTDELLFHDMIDRAWSHVHDTNEGEETSLRYYVCQLGIGMFPWTGIGAWAAVWGMQRGKGRGGAMLLLIGALAAFTLFSLLGTRFHHYIFPAVPPLALLVGIFLDDMLSQDAGTGRTPAGWVMRMTAVGGALIATLVARDLIATDKARPGALRLLQLFTYRYDRPWPELDLRLAFWFFGAGAVMLTLLLAWSRIRRHAIYCLAGLAVAWAGWGLDVYMVKTSRHWGQREVIAAWYANRQGPHEPLIAYQLNWKGENFYTGNHVAEFMPSAASLPSWIEEQKKRGVRTVFVATEHSHLGSLGSALHARSISAVTDRSDSRQFVLVRAEL